MICQNKNDQAKQARPYYAVWPNKGIRLSASRVEELPAEAGACAGSCVIIILNSGEKVK